MRKNKSYVVYDKVTGQILMAYSSPVKPITSQGHGFIEGKCEDTNNCVVDLLTLKIKSTT